MRHTINMYKRNQVTEVVVEVGPDFEQMNQQGKKLYLLKDRKVVLAREQGFSLDYIRQEYPKALYKGKDWVTVQNESDEAKAVKAGFGELKGSTDKVNSESLRNIPSAPSAEPTVKELKEKLNEIEEEETKILNDIDVGENPHEKYKEETGKPAVWKGKETAKFQKWLKTRG